MATAITAGLNQINEVGKTGGLTAPTPAAVDLELSVALEPIELPDGKRIYPPTVHGEPVDKVACSLLDMQDPRKSRFIKLIGPPGTGKSQIARAIAYRLWTGRGHQVEERHGMPFYGFVEMSGGPSSDEFTFQYDYVPDAEHPSDVKLVASAFVEAMENGWVVMIDEVNTIRDTALLSLNSTLDGRLSLYLAAEGRTVVAQPGFAVIIAYNPGLVGATDIPDAWYSRFPATLEVTSNWAALAQLYPQHTKLVKAAYTLDRRRLNGDDGLVWTPQFRDIESLAEMMDRVGDRLAIALFLSNLHEQVVAGKVQEAEAEAVGRMLDEAGYAGLHVAATAGVPRLGSYARAVTG